MSQTINITLSPQARAAIRKLDAQPRAALAPIRDAINLQNELTVGHIKNVMTSTDIPIVVAVLPRFDIF